MFTALVVLCLSLPGIGAEVEVFRTGRESIVTLERFDLLREVHPGLKAVLKLSGPGGTKDLAIDLADPAVKGSLIVDLSTFGDCMALGITVVDGNGKTILGKQVAPIPEAPAPSRFRVSTTGPFTADIRLHVGSWETATPALYKTPPPLGADVRKLGATMITDAGLLIQTAGGKYAEARGPWRLDLDERGYSKAFGEVNGLTDTMSKDGRTTFLPTQETKVNGVSKSSMVHVGTTWGRKLVSMTNPGELTIPRASIRQLLMSEGWNDSLLLPPTSKHAFRTYAGAPEGVVTVKYDVMEKVKAAPEAKGTLADSLSGGPSLGPCCLVTPVPGQADQALAVCEYAVYPLAKLDFSRIGERNAVTKTAVPPGGAVAAKLGPYDSLWVAQGDEQWLYITGYTGMTRIKYSKGGKVSAPMISDAFHSRMSPQPVDGHPRWGVETIRPDFSRLRWSADEFRHRSLGARWHGLHHRAGAFRSETTGPRRLS